MTIQRRRPYVPLPLARAVKGLFRVGARLRGGKRALHPDGVVFDAELRLFGDRSQAQGSILGEETAVPAIARLSRGVGLPKTLPDALGVAISVADLGRPGSRQDLLFTSSASLPGARHLPLPAPRGFFRHTFTTLWPYIVGQRVRMLALQPTGDERPSPAGITDDDDAEAIRFNPWNTADDLCPVGPLMGLRLPAYEGSQEGSAG